MHVRTAELDKATYPARGVGGWSEEVASLEDRWILGDLRNRGEEMGRCWCFGLGRWCAVRGRLNIGGSEDVSYWILAKLPQLQIFLHDFFVVVGQCQPRNFFLYWWSVAICSRSGGLWESDPTEQWLRCFNLSMSQLSPLRDDIISDQAYASRRPIRQAFLHHLKPKLYY